MENSSARTREYLALRISQLRKDVVEIDVLDYSALSVECARIHELEETLKVLNGAPIPATLKEVEA